MVFLRPKVILMFFQLMTTVTVITFCVPIMFCLRHQWMWMPGLLVTTLDWMDLSTVLLSKYSIRYFFFVDKLVYF
jgi:hypothetical protein